MGYENGIFFFMDGVMFYGMGLFINFWYDGSEIFYFFEKRILDVERMKEQVYECIVQEGMKYMIGFIVNVVVFMVGVRLSDICLVFRRVEELGLDYRFFYFSLWYQFIK